MTSWSVPRPHYELLCCAGDYGGAATSIEDIGSPGVSPLPAYYSAAEQSPITSSGTVQKGRPRKRKLSEVTGSELPVTMRLAAGALGKTFIPSIFIFSSFFYLSGWNRARNSFRKNCGKSIDRSIRAEEGGGKTGQQGTEKKNACPGGLLFLPSYSRETIKNSQESSLGSRPLSESRTQIRVIGSGEITRERKRGMERVAGGIIGPDGKRGCSLAFKRRS